MKTVRLRVLEFIRSHKLITTTDISRGLKMTPANARHHLKILMSQELVEIIGKRQSAGKGRPSLTYGISKHALGHNLDQLASALLLEINKSNPYLDRDSTLQAVAKQMLDPIRGQEHGSADVYEQIHLTKRLVNTVTRLNDLHYNARWEAHAHSPHIFLGNCPYISILPQHPELCMIDKYLIENLVISPVELIAKRTPDERGVPFCLFRLRT